MVWTMNICAPYGFRFWLWPWIFSSRVSTASALLLLLLLFIKCVENKSRGMHEWRIALACLFLLFFFFYSLKTTTLSHRNARDRRGPTAVTAISGHIKRCVFFFFTSSCFLTFFVIHFFCFLFSLFVVAAPRTNSDFVHTISCSSHLHCISWAI